MAACSGEDAIVCDKSDRSGAYLLEYAERDGGTCGEISDIVGRIDADAPIPAECELTADDEWSGNLCKFTRSMRCLDADGVLVDGVAVTEQQDSDGRVLSGLYTVQLSDAAGPICTSTYNVTATRQ